MQMALVTLMTFKTGAYNALHVKHADSFKQNTRHASISKLVDNSQVHLPQPASMQRGHNNIFVYIASVKLDKFVDL